ncbi:MAG: chorismate-binding protein, partial [Melioribacteraceae bacterium]|nr:chorismate-binding protein [Melioribacteraceae bacterium]
MNNIIEILKLVEEENNSAFFYTPQLIKNGVCYFFKKPAASIVCNNFFEIDNTLSRINKLKNKYPIAYGYISYETGYYFEEKLRDLCHSETNIPFIKFHFFEPDQVLKINSITLDFTDVDSVLKNQKINISDFKLNTSKKEYINNIKKIKNYIKEGDTYQVNYTVKGKFHFNENIWALFLNLIFNQSASYAAIINDGDKYV